MCSNNAAVSRLIILQANVIRRLIVSLKIVLAAFSLHIILAIPFRSVHDFA